MKGYKGFEKGLICRGKQYAENTVFEEDKAEICKSGMHFCERPIDVLAFYPPCDVNGNLNDFAEVEALDEALTDDNTKYTTKKLKVGAKIGIVGLIKAEVEYIKEQIAKTPNNLKAVNSGDRSSAANSGDSSSAVNSGYRSSAVNSGDSSSAVNSGKEGIAVALGIESKAKAALGGWLVLSEWEYDEENYQWHRIAVKSRKVDGNKIKADTFYKLKNGRFVEENEE